MSNFFNDFGLFSFMNKICNNLYMWHPIFLSMKAIPVTLMFIKKINIILLFFLILYWVINVFSVKKSSDIADKKIIKGFLYLTTILIKATHFWFFFCFYIFKNRYSHFIYIYLCKPHSYDTYRLQRFKILKIMITYFFAIEVMIFISQQDQFLLW